jgi:hypothetical protein
VDTELEQRLNDKIKRADRVIFSCIIALFVLVIVFFGGLIYQNQKNADLSREQARQNHKRTQEYVRCVAETLTIPIDKRSDSALDNCTKAADDRTKEAEKQ